MAPTRQIQGVRIDWVHGVFALLSAREEAIAEIGVGSGADSYYAGLQEEEVEGEGKEECSGDDSGAHIES